MRSVCFSTSWGCVTVRYSEMGIQSVILPASNRTETEVDRESNAQIAICGYLKKLKDKLTAYFNGDCVKFDFPLDLSAVTEFCRRVLLVVKDIPYGEVRSYQWVAGELGVLSSARAVGQALARNPVPVIIPCHRVIRANGTLGGFAGRAEAGETKIKLLALEGYKFKNKDTR